jgi:hypothetical protein
MAIEASEYFEQLRAGRVVIVVDDPAAAAALGELVELRELGELVALADYDLLVEHERPALVVATRLDTVDALYERWDDAPALFTHLSLARYDPREQATREAAIALCSVDFGSALARRAERYDALCSSDAIEIMTSAGRLRIECADELEIANMSTQVRPRWLQAVSEFLEASVVNLESERSSFRVDGALAFAGFASLVNVAALGERFSAPLQELRRAAAASGDNRVEFVDNRLTRVIIAGVDVSARFCAMLGDDHRGGSALEFGFGCAALHPDWSINSPLHKCCNGVFVGVGTGHLAPHLDFVAPAAQLRFIPIASE